MPETPSRKVHPIVNINFLPRILAAHSLFIITWFVWQSKLLQAPYIFFYSTGIVWPYLALYLSRKARDGKKQEILNMHFDAVLMSLVTMVTPSYHFIGAILIVLFANALFIGSVKLLMTTISLYFVCVLAGFLTINIDFISTSLFVQLSLMGFLLIYFGAFSLMGYNMTRRLIKLNKTVQQLSIKDPLTGCFNRLYLDKQLTKELHRCHRVKYPLTLIFADLDHFKKVNDDYGHHAGDAVLKQFADIARLCIREDVDWIARFGGEEFVIVLTNSDVINGRRVAERIRQKIDEHEFLFDGAPLHVTCSFGVSGMTADNTQAEADVLLAQADNGLYQAKANGRNRVEVVDNVAA